MSISVAIAESDLMSFYHDPIGKESPFAEGRRWFRNLRNSKKLCICVIVDINGRVAKTTRCQCVFINY